MICNDKSCFSPETIKRLTVYLQNFKRLKKNNVEIVSSGEISKLLNVSPEQFRKDLSYFGEFGKRGVGYSTTTMVDELEGILGLDKKWTVALVGVGKLGSSLLNYPGFSELNVKFTAAFDSDKKKHGKIINNVEVHDVIHFKKIIKKRKIKICVICIPVENVQEVADMVVDSGIQAILNFAPIVLNVPEKIYVSNMDIYSEIERLIYYLNK